MKLKFYKLTFLSLCIWNYAQAAIKITNDDILDVIDSCDYTRFDNQLIKLQIGNDILQHNMSNIQKDLDRQKDILSDLKRSIKSLPQQIEAMQANLIQNNKQNIDDLIDFIRKEIQMQNAMVPPPVDDKIILIADMRETLKKHDKMLNEIIKNQNQSQTLLNEMNLEKHTQALKNTISEKLAIMAQIDGKLTAIDNRTKSRDILNDVIRNQENIKSLLKENNLDKHTQALKNTISEKLAIMAQIDGKLTAIDNRTKSRDILNDVIRNQENMKSLLKEINLEKHTQALKNTISEKLAIMGQIDGKLTAIDTRTKSRDVLNDVVRNQEDIKSLLKETNSTLQNTISEKLGIMPQIDGKLIAVVTNQENIKSRLKEINLEKHTQGLTNTISDKLRQYLQKIDVSKICFKDDNQTLTCTSKSYPTSCADFDAAVCEDNKCPIINNLYGPKPFVVACNNSIDGGGWTVIQRRINGAVDFNRNWSEYKHGFGDIDAEFFIGLEKLYALTSTLQPVELFIQLQDFENVTKYAKYDDFQVGSEASNYKLIKIGSYVGDAGDSFSRHVGFSFSTNGSDNDDHTGNCAEYFTAGWWYYKCYESNLNGKYYQHPTKFYNATENNSGINWRTFHGYDYSLKSVQMLIRPRKS